MDLAGVQGRLAALGVTLAFEDDPPASAAQLVLQRQYRAALYIRRLEDVHRFLTDGTVAGSPAGPVVAGQNGLGPDYPFAQPALSSGALLNDLAESLDTWLLAAVDLSIRAAAPRVNNPTPYEGWFTSQIYDPAVINFDIARSSTNKGETLEDTLATLEAMEADAFIVRHKDNGTPARCAAHARRAAIVNAGDGNHAHPTQGLLDLLTIRDHKKDIEGLKVTICGDVRHSRVARSDIDGLAALGAGEIRICGPAALLPDRSEFPGCRIIEDFDTALAGSDVVIMLRLQKERMQDALGLAEADYFAAYGLTAARLARAREDALVMHPGPMNRGIEIADAVADGSQSVILEQVANGIFVRMAVLAALLADR